MVYSYTSTVLCICVVDICILMHTHSELVPAICRMYAHAFVLLAALINIINPYA